MTQETLLEIIKTAGKLKTSTRHNWTEGERKESVADHSYRIALIAMLLSGEKEFESLDMDRVIRMCLIHDLGEAFTGDIPSFYKTEKDSDREEDIFLSWVRGFPSPQREEWSSLLEEMRLLQSPEAKVYKALDKIEAVISHNEADISSWLPLEYELQLTYAREQCGFSEYLDELRRLVDEWTLAKIEEGNV